MRYATLIALSTTPLVVVVSAGPETGTAAAGTAQVERHPCGAYVCAGPMSYRAAPGEVNALTVSGTTVVSPSTVTFRDPAGIAAGSDCAPVDAQTVRCGFPDEGNIYSTDEVSIDLGDGDDVLDARKLRPTASLLLRTGRGDDLIFGSELPSIFEGGPGKDVMIGGANSDVFRGESRADGSDTIVGGGAPVGRARSARTIPDAADYSARRRPVRARLDGKRNDGEHLERDNLLGIEIVRGGSANDVLLGSWRADGLWGGQGDDLLRGSGGEDHLTGELPFGLGNAGAGNDRLLGGRGADVLDAGPGRDLVDGGPGLNQLDAGAGHDRIFARQRSRDWILCGRGIDRLRVDQSDVPMRGCERGIRRARSAPAPLAFTQTGEDGLTVIIGCPVTARSDCVGEVRVSLDGSHLGSAPFTVPAGTAALPLVPLSGDLDHEDSEVAVTVGSYSTTLAALPWYSRTHGVASVLDGYRWAGGL